MLDAAASSSLSAKQARPDQLRVKSQLTSCTAARKARHRKRKGVPLSLVPKRITLGIPPIPSAPPKKGT